MKHKINHQEIDSHLMVLFRAAKAAEEESRNGNYSEVIADNLMVVLGQARIVVSHFENEAANLEYTSDDHDLMGIRRKAQAALWEWRRSNGSRLVLLDHLSKIVGAAHSALTEQGSVI